MEKNDVKRNYALDVIRALAITLVLTIHAFSFKASEGASVLQEGILCLAKMAVPLFLLLTGYLNNRKTVEDYYQKGKWKGCFRVLLAYIALGSLCYVGSVCMGHEAGVVDYVKQTLAFKLTPYGWYVEMWVGLFFLTPFFNIIFNNLDKKSENLLLVSLLLLSSFALFINRNGNTILPSFWMCLWPVTLYFLGAYLSHNSVKVRKRVLFIVLLVVALGEPLLNIIVHSKTYLYFWGGQDGIIYLISAFVVFAFILDKCKNIHLNNLYLGGVILISKQSLNMYLISALFDSVGRHFLKEQLSVSTIAVIPYLFVLLFFSFVCSLIVSCLYDKISRKILYLIK